MIKKILLVSTLLLLETFLWYVVKELSKEQIPAYHIVKTVEP